MLKGTFYFLFYLFIFFRMKKQQKLDPLNNRSRVRKGCVAEVANKIKGTVSLLLLGYSVLHIFLKYNLSVK